MSVFGIKCAVQTYAWGKISSDSEVAKLSSCDPNFQLQEDTPYAELWMGTHPKGPSEIPELKQTLSHWIESNPTSIGEKVRADFPAAGQLPFLFKVLSVNKSLSIQAHPNKKHAEELHAARPDKYPDANHKPEMAIALTPFEGLCGFRPKQQIVDFLTRVPEFRAVIGQDLADEFCKTNDPQEEKAALKRCFTSLMTRDADTVKIQLDVLTKKLGLANARHEDISDMEGELVLRLNDQFPGDVGIFSVYFMNHMRLQPGEAMFLEANLPHAYLSGDCMECMACSDNVVRAGLTPKFIDVPVLCEMLTYECRRAEDNLFPSQSHPSDPCVTIYNPPIKDFCVARIQIPSEQKQYSVSELDSASIVLVIQGKATGTTASGESRAINKGTVLFMEASSTLNLDITSEGMLMFRAYCQL